MPPPAFLLCLLPQEASTPLPIRNPDMIFWLLPLSLSKFSPSVFFFFTHVSIRFSLLISFPIHPLISFLMAPTLAWRPSPVPTSSQAPCLWDCLCSLLCSSAQLVLGSVSCLCFLSGMSPSFKVPSSLTSLKIMVMV